MDNKVLKSSVEEDLTAIQIKKEKREELKEKIESKS